MNKNNFIWITILLVFVLVSSSYASGTLVNYFTNTPNTDAVISAYYGTQFVPNYNNCSENITNINITFGATTPKEFIIWENQSSRVRNGSCTTNGCAITPPYITNPTSKNFTILVGNYASNWNLYYIGTGLPKLWATSPFNMTQRATAVNGATAPVVASAGEVDSVFGIVATNYTTACAGGIPASSNFSITARDYYYADTITSFSASINGTLYTTTNGQINTTISNLAIPLFTVYINATNYFNQQYTNYNVSTNLLANLTNTRVKINITANSKISGASLSTYTAVLNSLNSSDSLSYSTTNGSIIARGLWNETYNLTTDATSYSSNFTYLIFNNGSLPNKRIDLYPENTIISTIRDEQTQQIINETITLNLFSETYATTYATQNGTIIANNLTPDTYRLDFSGANYSLKTYYVTVASDTSTLLDVWLLRNGSYQLTSFTTRDAGTTNLVPNAVLTFTRNINNSWVTVAQKNTGIGGIGSVNLQPNAVYNLMITALGYQTKTLQLEIDTTAYTIYLSENSTTNFNSYINDITYLISPSSNILSPTVSQNFTFVLSSPAGNLNYFSVGTNYTGTTYLSNITGSVAGGTSYITLNTSGQNRTSITLKYFIASQNGNLLEINKTYYLYNLTPSNSSLQFVLNDIAQTIPTFYRIIFAIIVSLFIGAGFFTILGSLGSSFVAMITMLIFSVTGFIPFLFALIPCVLIIIGFLAFGGDSFT